ncbi:uncharacterized protein LOC119654505 [Hermetia illucens]|uniref:uncharacterized protein LOC119654505 n=1 Tax=Hermetia illucens TaxID=343691 RepID=UPI0018CC6FD5|nr:uncharacterized protein LOC119654505 [Hermetia illucens]
MSQPTPPKQSKCTESDNQFLPEDFDNKHTPSSGLKPTQHGVDYQLLLLCLCLWRVLKNKISDFLLATELPEAAKFDDVVVKYKHEDTTVLRFLQAKHKEAPCPTDSIHKITLTDLLTPDEGKEFSLLKYFRSFVKILEKRSQNPVPAFLEGADIQEFILSTNIDLAEEVEQYFEVDQEDSLEEDKVLGVPTGQTRKLKIKEADNELTRQLEILFYISSDFNELVEKLADCLLLQQRFDGNSRIFKEYYYPLVKHVFEFESNQVAKLSDGFKGANSQRTAEVEEFRKAFIKEVAFRMILREINKSTSKGNRYPQSDTNRKRKLHTNDSQLSTEELKGLVDQSKTAVYSALRRDATLLNEVVDDKTMEIWDDFVNGTEKLSRKAQLFRKRLIDEVMDRHDGNMTEIVFNKVSDVTFPVSKGYANRFQPKSNPKIEDVQVFVEDIADLIDKCTGDTIEITDVVGTEQFRRNIIELAGHAIVKVSSRFQFSGNFIRDRRGRSLANGLIEFRKALFERLKKKKFDCIDKYSLNIKLKGFTSCEEAALHTTLPSPVKKESIEDFYENFRLIVSYPNRYELRQLLEAEVKAENQLLNSKAFVDSFVQQISQWMTDRLGTFYTPKKAEELLRRIDENLSCYELDGINQSFYLALPTKYKFKCEDLMTLVKDFLEQTQSSVLLLRSENLTLCCVRLMQAFWSLQKKDANGELPSYLRRFGYLFMTIKHLLDESFSGKLGKRNQDKDQWNLRVVECWTENLPGAAKFETVLNLLFESSDSPSVARKVIFIVKEDMSRKLESALGSYFTKQGNTHIKPSTFELKTTFSQLEAPSQDELLKRGQVKLNGHDCQLGNIVNQDTGDLIDETALAKLITECNDDTGIVCIGSTTQQFEGIFDPDCYIMRDIAPVVIGTASYKREEDTEGSSYYLSKKEGEKDLLIVAHSRSEFDKIRTRLKENQKYSPPEPIHWVQKHSSSWRETDFIWRDSIGSISSLNKHRKRDTDDYLLREQKFLESVRDRKIVVLQGVPGMGKSMLLRNFFIQMTDNSQLLWKIYIKLNLYTDFLDKRQNFFKEKQNEAGDRVDTETPSSKCSEFLFELLQSTEHSKLKTQFEINLLHSAFKSEADTTPITRKMKLVLFMDGFDEISPDYKEIVLSFLRLWKACSHASQIFITTRPSYREYLERKLQTFSFELRGLTWDDQKSLLIKLIRKSKIQINAFSLMIEPIVCNEVPLHLKMFVDILACTDQKQIQQSVNDDDLSTLYEAYVKRKYELYQEEKMLTDLTNVASKQEFQYAYNIFLNNHTNLALWALFSEKNLKRIVSSFEKFKENVCSLLEDIEAGKFKYGIVHGVSYGKPEFVHRTFAEYLAARFFISQIKSNNKLEQGFLDFFILILTESSYEVRRFYNGMIGKIHWNYGHFKNMKPSHIAESLICFYNYDLWGLFSFFGKIFKTYCPEDVYADRFRIRNSVRPDEDLTWEMAFTYLLDSCLLSETNLVLLHFLMKWRTASVFRSLPPHDYPVGNEYKVEYDPKSERLEFIFDGKRKFLPAWLIQQEGFTICDYYKNLKMNAVSITLNIT